MRSLCLTIAVLLAGCSFVFTRGPSERPQAYPDCTSSMTWPIVDAVFSALFLTAMISALAEDDTMSTSFDDDDRSTKGQKVASAALFTAATGVGAFVGYRRVSRCRAARETYRSQYPLGTGPYGAQYPQPYPQQYPQPYPGQQPQPYPGQQPQQYYPPAPTPTPQPQPQPQPTTQPGPVPAATALGTEGDVCASSAECATGLACTSNVCVRPPAKQ